jgi:hypothetical protein
MCSGAGLGSVASGFFQGLGSIMQGRQQRDNYDARATQDDLDASYERSDAAVRATKTRKAGAIVQSGARAGFAASGVDVTRGTPLAVGQYIGRNVEEDALTQLLTGERRATALEKEATGLRGAARNASTTSLLSAWSSLLGGAGNAYSSQQSSDNWIRLTNAQNNRYGP